MANKLHTEDMHMSPIARLLDRPVNQDFGRVDCYNLVLVQCPVSRTMTLLWTWRMAIRKCNKETRSLDHVCS